MSSRREQFRAVLAGGECVHPSSVFDPLLGADGGGYRLRDRHVRGSIASLTVLGAPDIIVVTLSEFADQIRRITRGGISRCWWMPITATATRIT
jgi:carboxyvinyl-carboxyphosphonate phosphorylmutase